MNFIFFSTQQIFLIITWRSIIYRTGSVSEIPRWFDEIQGRRRLKIWVMRLYVSLQIGLIRHSFREWSIRLIITTPRFGRRDSVTRMLLLDCRFFYTYCIFIIGKNIGDFQRTSCSLQFILEYFIHFSFFRFPINARKSALIKRYIDAKFFALSRVEMSAIFSFRENDKLEKTVNASSLMRRLFSG